MTRAFCRAVCVPVSRLKVNTLILAAHLQKVQHGYSVKHYLIWCCGLKETHTVSHTSCYLPIFTFSPVVHLAVVLGEVVKETCLTLAHLDQAAVVWTVIAVTTEELPTKLISAEERELM